MRRVVPVGGNSTQDALFCGEMWGSVGHMPGRSLTGTHECRLDNRFRLAIPARLREPFGDGAMVGWWFDDCLVVVPSSDWAPLIEKTFGAMSVLDDESREMSRFLSAGAYEQELDKQGRVLLPSNLRDYAQIDGLAQVVGAGAYLEIWDPGRLDQRFSALLSEGVSARANRLANRAA